MRGVRPIAGLVECVLVEVIEEICIWVRSREPKPPRIQSEIDKNC